MKYSYSKEKHAFFAHDLRAQYDAAGTWPADAVELPEGLHEKLIEGQSIGKEIFCDVDGLPALRERVKAYSAAQAERSKKALMQVATDTIAPLQDAVDLGRATEEQSALLLAWKHYRVDLMEAPLADTGVWPKQPGSMEDE